MGKHANSLLANVSASAVAVAHKSRAHSIIGPSAAHRWIPCPASVGRSQNRRDGGNMFAMEGTAGHELVEFVMRNGVNPYDFVGGIIDLRDDALRRVSPKGRNDVEFDDWFVWPITEEMAWSAVIYRDAYRAIVEPGDIVEYETRLDMREIHTELFGTGDGLIYKRKKRTLYILDFKYGSGVLVEVKDNEQLLTYGVGAVLRFGWQNVDRVVLVIIQPRMDHRDGPVRTHEVSIDELRAFAEHLRERAAKTHADDAEVCAGHQCRFCPVAGYCPEFKDWIYETIGLPVVRKKKRGPLLLPALKDLDEDDLGRILEDAKLIEAWVKQVRSYAHERALNGHIPTGQKLVPGRAYRHFIDSEDAEEFLSALFDEEDFKTSPELRSVAQIEERVGKKLFKKLFPPEAISQTSTKVVLAPMSDPREAITIQRGECFGAVDED